MQMSIRLQNSIAASLGAWIVLIFMLVQHAQAAEGLLSPEQAFSFNVESTSQDQAELSWNIQPNYYLYQHKFEVRQGNQPLSLKLPKAIDQFDDNFGHTKVYYDQVHFSIRTQPSQHYQVTWQGCAKDRICYPPQTFDFETDADGLINAQSTTANAPKRLTDLAGLSSAKMKPPPQQQIRPHQPNPQAQRQWHKIRHGHRNLNSIHSVIPFCCL